MIQTQVQTKIKVFKSNNVKYYFNSILGEYLMSQGYSTLKLLWWHTSIKPSGRKEKLKFSWSSQIYYVHYKCSQTFLGYIWQSSQPHTSLIKCHQESYNSKHFVKLFSSPIQIPESSHLYHKKYLGVRHLSISMNNFKADLT